MRALALSLSLALAIPAFSGPAPATAQGPRMLRIHIIEKSSLRHRHHADEGDKKTEKKEEPTEVNIRVPLRVAKGVLSAAGESEIKVNGKSKKGIKVDELQKLLEGSQPGEILLELTTDKGDLIKITVE